MNWTFWTRTQPTNPDDCGAIDPLVSLYADGMASSEEARRVEAHLPVCAACRESLAWMRATQFALASRPVALPPADLRARIAGAIAASSGSLVPASFTVRRSFTVCRSFTVRPAYAAAASVALLGFIGYGLLHHPQPAAIHPAPPPQLAAVPHTHPSSPVVKGMTAYGVKPHAARHSSAAPQPVRFDPDRIALSQPDEVVPAPAVVKTHLQPKPQTSMVAKAAPFMAPEKAPLAAIKKPAPRKFRPEMLATSKGAAPAAETHKASVFKPEPKNTDTTVVADLPHPQTPAAPSIIEKQPVITPDPAPTVTVASAGGGRLQTAEEHGVIKVHLAMQTFAHQTLNRAESGSSKIGYIPLVSSP